MPARQSALQVIAVTGIGMTLGALPHLAAGRPARRASMASRLLAVAFAAFAFRPLAGTSAVIRHWWTAFAVLAVLVALAWLVNMVLEAAVRASVLRAQLWVTFTDEVRVLGPLGVAVGASATLIVFAAEAMGLVAVAVFIAPLLVTQVAFRRYAGIRATYLQTVRALARVTEIGGYVEAGHSDRVSRLAVAVGRSSGPVRAAAAGAPVRGADPRHRPALAARPDPGRGDRAGVAGGPAPDRRAGRRGHRAGPDAGQRGRDRPPPERPVPGPGRCRCAAPPLSSRIIRAVNAFDDLVGSSANPGRATAVVDRLRLDTSTEYDPEVVEALARVIARQ